MSDNLSVCIENFPMLSISILSWNVRGAGSCIAKRMIKDLVTVRKINFICLQETKIGKWSDAMIKSMWNSQEMDWEDVESRGQAGGLLCLWDATLYKKVVIRRSDC